MQVKFITLVAPEIYNHCQNEMQILKGTYHLLNTFANKIEKQRFKFIIEESPQKLIKYIHDGEILRIILTNFEQIKYLKWDGQFGTQKLPIGHWKMIWKGEKQIYGGNYNHCGKKEGEWVEPFDAFWDRCQIFCVGKYSKGLRIGKWVYQQDEQLIGGGYYNGYGRKEGYWVELHENFDQNCQVMIQGEYNNKKKYGAWIYKLRESSKTKFQIIPGGIYNEDGLKHGKWTNLWHSYDDDLQYISVGEYNLGIKQGIWNTMKIKFNGQYQIIGCGVFDENEFENGYWLELNKIQRYHYHDIVSYGQYNHGRKIGTWNTLIQSQIVGTGSYNQEGNKHGKWIHIPKRLQFEKISLVEYPIKEKLITFVGEYNNGLKQGSWRIKKGNNLIGGGEYNLKGLKIENWIEIWNFKMSCFVIQRGEYKNGIRQGKWVTQFKKNSGEKTLQNIGEGIYDNQGMKHGKWISLHDNYNYNCQVLDVGYYYHGIKQGTWNFQTINYHEHDVFSPFSFGHMNNFYKIAGGNYQDGIKIGKWVELDEFYRYKSQILYEGEYTNDIKQGKWEMMKHHNQNFKRLGGGCFDQDGFKNSKWMELDQNDKLRLKFVEYQNGKRNSTQKNDYGIENQNILFN